MSLQPYIIGIAGGSGSGKTSFLNELKSRFANLSVTFINLDDYYKPRDIQFTDENGIKNFDLPSAIDNDKIAEDLNALLAGQTLVKEKYTFNNAKEEKTTYELKPAKVYIIEGLFVYHYQNINKHFDLRLYIDAGDELKLIRRIKRDRTERNYPLEDVIYRYEHHVMPSYRQYIEPYKAKCDLIINNNEAYNGALKVIITYLEALL